MDGCCFIEWYELVSRDILVRFALDERSGATATTSGDDVDVQCASEGAQIDAVSPTFACIEVVVVASVVVSPNDWQCRCC